MRFMIHHTLEPGTSPEDVRALASKLLEKKEEIRPVRSFFCLSENKGVCVFDAPDRQSFLDWLKRNELPYDDIYEVELQGEAGNFTVLHEPAETHSP